MIEERVRLRHELPHFRAMTRDGTAWALTLDGLESFRYAWTSGKAFWSGKTIWGQPIDIKLADITGVNVSTEESLALIQEEEAETKRREITS